MSDILLRWYCRRQPVGRTDSFFGSLASVVTWGRFKSTPLRSILLSVVVARWNKFHPGAMQHYEGSDAAGSNACSGILDRCACPLAANAAAKIRNQQRKSLPGRCLYVSRTTSRKCFFSTAQCSQKFACAPVRFERLMPWQVRNVDHKKAYNYAGGGRAETQVRIKIESETLIT